MRASSLYLFVGLALCACGSPASDSTTDQHADSIRANETSQETEPSACVSEHSNLTGNGLGAVQIGMPASDLLQQCPSAVHTTNTDIEGQPQPVILVPAGSDTVRAEILGGEVWRITVDDAAWQTADSLGVGTRISKLLQLPEVRGLTGEGNLVIISPQQCGLSFQLERTGVAPGGEWDRAALERLPSATEVELVRIVGCESPENRPR